MRPIIVLILSVAVYFAPMTGRAEEGKQEHDRTGGKISTNYEGGRFLLDGGVHVLGFFPMLFVRGRFQVNRYVAVEQTNRIFVPFPVNSHHLVGVRGQILLPKFWSVFATARVGIQVDVFGLQPVASGPGVKGQVVEAGIGAERVAPTNVLYGFELGAGRYFGRLGPRITVPQVRLNVGYAF